MAEQGIVKIQAQSICLATFQRTAVKRFIVPMPIIEPVIVCVVLTAAPISVEKKIVTAAPDTVQNPSTGLSFATFWPMALTILQPPNIVPRAGDE